MASSNKPAFITKYLNRAKQALERPYKIPVGVVVFNEIPEETLKLPPPPIQENVLGTQLAVAITTQDGYMIEIIP